MVTADTYKLALSRYLLFLPFQILPTLGFLSIPGELYPIVQSNHCLALSDMIAPAVFVASFIFCGFLEIGDQIEQPLGYDSCDLDMGTFAVNIAKELHELAAMPPGDPADFFFSSLNEPLAPTDVRSAVELVSSGVTVREIQSALKTGHDGHTGTISRSYTQLQRGSSVDESSRPVSRKPSDFSVSMPKLGKTKSEVGMV